MIFANAKSHAAPGTGAISAQVVTQINVSDTVAAAARKMLAANVHSVYDSR